MPPRHVSTSRHATRPAVGLRIGRSAAWDATLHIILGLLTIGAGNVAGGFLAGTTGIVGLAFYLLVAVSTFVYGMFYVIIGAGMVVKTAAEHALGAAELTVEVGDDNDGGEGRDSGGDRGDDARSPAHD